MAVAVASSSPRQGNQRGDASNHVVRKLPKFRCRTAVMDEDGHVSGRERYTVYCGDEDVDDNFPIALKSELAAHEEHSCVLSEIPHELGLGLHLTAPMSQRTTFDGRRTADSSDVRDSFSSGRWSSISCKSLVGRSSDRSSWRTSNKSSSCTDNRLTFDKPDALNANTTFVAGASSLLRGSKSNGGTLSPDADDLHIRVLTEQESLKHVGKYFRRVASATPQRNRIEELLVLQQFHSNRSQGPNQAPVGLVAEECANPCEGSVALVPAKPPKALKKGHTRGKFNMVRRDVLAE